MTPLQMLKYALSVHKYPRYIEDFRIARLMPIVWRRRGVVLGRGIVWYGAPLIAVYPGSTISIGDCTSICSRSSQTALGVNHPTILRTLRKGAELYVGDGVRMSGTTVCAAERIRIGDRCVIGANATIVDTDFHALDPAVRSSPRDGDSATTSPVEIGSDVFIGGGSCILKGVRIGDGAVIGAGSVVTRDVEPRQIVAGNPARPLAQRETTAPGK
jgi:acetyltransferase-like isoleucine patch superfamily enzyme